MPPTPADIAAIVPAYNRRRIMIEALASVAGQDRPPRVLIVVDDGSTDGTAEAAEGWIAAERPPFPVRVIRQANAGAAAARNRGAAEAGEADLLAFLDSDDLWPTDYLARMADALAARPDAVAASCDRLDRDEQAGRAEHKALSWVRDKAPARMFDRGSPGTPNTVIRREAFEKVGGYDAGVRCGEDYQLMLRLSLLGPWAYVPGDPVVVRRNLPGESGEATGQLSRAFDDRRYRLARVLDRFIEADGGREAIPDAVWRRRLGRLWHAAGRQLLKTDRREEAGRCFRRAVEVMPWHWRARLRSWAVRS